MKIDKIRAQLISAIWQAVAQSGVNLTEITKEDQDKLVTQIADQVMVTMDSILDQDNSLAENEFPKSDLIDENEDILWQGRPFLSLVESYTLTSERLQIIRGLLSRHVENYELIRIQDIDFKQAVGERIVGVGDISIRGHDSSDPEIVLRNVSNPDEVYEILRKAWIAARKRHGLQFREYM